MGELELRSRKLREIAEMSRFWDAEDLIRNMELEVDRLERGLDHIIWDINNRPVTKWPRPMPITPRFEISSEGETFSLKVYLPNVPRENIRVNIDRDSVEVMACFDDIICRPYYLDFDAGCILRPDEAEAAFSEGLLEVRAPKAKKTRLPIR